jgi:hypothetical protein
VKDRRERASSVQTGAHGEIFRLSITGPFRPAGSGITQEANESTEWMRVQIVTFTLLVSSLAFVTARQPLTMSVSPMQSFGPTTLTVRVHVEPSADNRILEVVVESDEYYRSSRVPLEGQDAPRTTSLELRNLPSGTYEVRGALIDGVGHDRAAVRARVIVLESAAGDERDEGPPYRTGRVGMRARFHNVLS